jgi:hypothetical protein
LPLTSISPFQVIHPLRAVSYLPGGTLARDFEEHALAKAAQAERDKTARRAQLRQALAKLL